MIDVRSLFAVMVTTNLVLAVSLWIGTGRRLGAGLAPWTLSLLAQAGAFVLFSGRGQIPDWASVVVPNGLLGVSFALAAAAILEFRGKRLPRVAPAAAAGVAVLAVGIPLDDPTLRFALANVLHAAFAAAVGAIAWKREPGVSAGPHGLFLASFATGAASFAVRGTAPLLDPSAAGGLLAPAPVQAVALLATWGAILLSTVSFLLMQRERAEHLSRELASVDPLTGVFNRRTFLELAGRQLARARRLETPLSLVLLDVDHFKRVNDTHGHLAGDRVLRRFAEVVGEQLRQEDILVRYGGEEFCLLLPDVPGPGAVALAGRIRKAVERASFGIDGADLSLTVSAGVASRIDEGPESLDALIARADEALYVAKHRGRNRVAAVSMGRSRAA